MCCGPLTLAFAKEYVPFTFTTHRTEVQNRSQLFCFYISVPSIGFQPQKSNRLENKLNSK